MFSLEKYLETFFTEKEIGADNFWLIVNYLKEKGCYVLPENLIRIIPKHQIEIPFIIKDHPLYLCVNKYDDKIEEIYTLEYLKDNTTPNNIIYFYGDKKGIRIDKIKRGYLGFIYSHDDFGICEYYNGESASYLEYENFGFPILPIPKYILPDYKFGTNGDILRRFKAIETKLDKILAENNLEEIKETIKK